MTCRGMVLKLTTAALSLVLGWAMLGCSGGDDEGGSLVGDWRIVSIARIDGLITNIEKMPDDRIRIISFKSSKDCITGEFRNVGNFWIETDIDTTQYLNNGSTLDMIEGYYDGDTIVPDTITYQYKIDGADLIVTNRYYDDEDQKEYCEEITLKKVNIADIKKSLGTIYGPDPAISGYWIIKGNDNVTESLTLSSDGDFYGGYRYRKAGASFGFWCTNGAKLILIDYDDYTMQAELNYSVSGTGLDRILKINGDTWTLDQREYLYAQAKSRQGKKIVKNGGGIFSPLSNLSGR